MHIYQNQVSLNLVYFRNKLIGDLYQYNDHINYINICFSILVLIIQVYLLIRNKRINNDIK